MTFRTALAAVGFAALAAAVPASSARSDRFVVLPLVTNADDAQLVNPWGLAGRPGGPWWVANEARSSSTLYAGDGHKQVGTVSVAGGPTGVVVYGGRGFRLRDHDLSAPARFIFACEDGMIRAWTPSIPGGWSTQTEVVVDAGGTAAVFRGLALARGRLYATDFHNARVLVFDSRWSPVDVHGAFVDRSIPAWYAPFGIQAFDGHLFVTYAWRAPVNGNDAPTGGYVDEFDPDGRLVARVGRTKHLNEPWGMALAPPGFGRLGGDLLVANFGSGRINIYRHDRHGWSFRGRLPVKVPGVWGIAFGSGGMSGPRTSLFYAAGPHGWRGATEVDVHGVFGSIAPAG